ncbi:LacI family DNA-binding transcriptional regulator [Rhodococcus sp. BH5]|uniref:LacI family DNA-binding transcriptional regulator n=1 Tax=Rhodococcus sp. BH5 TaxID=2871702 RepID=UPI0022CD9D82|nr:LacI family DNA-binding transcriptional regulator [Rhodococcus sp. BH5]MCZ9635344.1 LacI family transcriptional regulator [Rhodococcus sp. BH5]
MVQDQRRRKRATSSDVAAHAGVSRTTVSLVVNRQDKSISKSTRDRVKRSIEILEYIPDANAKSLRSHHTDIVLMSIPNYHDADVAVRFVTKFRQELEKYNLRLIIDADMNSLPAESVRRWCSYRPRVVFAPSSICGKESADLLRREGVMGILLMSDKPVRYASSLVMSQGVGEVAARFLIEKKGHRRIAYLAPPNSNSYDFADTKYHEFMRISTKFGATTEKINFDLTKGEIVKIVQNWILEGSLPSAIYAYNDNYAIALISVLSKCGVRVPEDIDVVGTDNTDLGSILELTTVFLDIEKLAKRAAYSVVRLAAGKSLSSKRSRNDLVAELVERKTTI